VIKINDNSTSQKEEKCNYCNNSTVIQRFHSGEHLCSDCFVKNIEKITYKTISKYKMLKPRDKIIVAFSGGKDSISLLYNLIKIQEKNYSALPLIALSIDEGIGEYRQNSIKSGSEFCEKYNVKHVIVSFKERVGKTLDEIVRIKKNNKNYLYACNYCATLRRRLLNDVAKELGGDVLALGHNLTDIAETYLMNILFKRYNLIGNQYLFKSEIREDNKYYIKKITPLMRIPEEEIRLYVKVKNFNCYSLQCPYREKEPILRKRVLNFIQDCKKYSPEIEFNLLNGFLEFSDLIYHHYKKKELNFCQECEYPCASKYCNYCNLIRELKI